MLKYFHFHFQHHGTDLLCDKKRFQTRFQLQIGFEGAANCPELDASVSTAVNAAKDLARHLAQAALQQAHELNMATKQGQELVATIRQQAIVSDVDRLHQTSEAFHDSIDHILEVNLFLNEYFAIKLVCVVRCANY